MGKEYWFRSSSIILETDEPDTQTELPFDNEHNNGESTVSFYKNGKKLKKENEDQTYKYEDFEKEILDATKEIINRNFEHIILLSGAGTSVVDDGSLGKTMKKLWSVIDEELKQQSDLYLLKELCELTNFEFEYDKDRTINSDLEDFLSHLQVFENFSNDTKYSKTLEKVLNIIKENVSYNYDFNKVNHHRVIELLSNRIEEPNKLMIVTTNYDILFESAAEELNYTVIDGFSFSSVPAFNSDNFDWNLVKHIPNITTKELEYKPNVIDLLKIHGSITWEKVFEKIYRKPKENVDNPLMIFPTRNKYSQSYDEPYFELFGKFQEALKRNNTLIITSGFSFSDKHITRMIEQSLKNNNGLSMLVTDMNITEVKNDGWEKIVNLMNKELQVAFLKTKFSELDRYLR
jgi:NAD-dependent SIR2 family protein deacetylase